MKYERFWQLVAELGPDLRVARLELKLRSLSWDTIYDVRTLLTDAAATIDTPSHRLHALSAYEHGYHPEGHTIGRQPRRSTGQLADFQDLQMTVVALGRDAWSAVHATPSLLAASWPTGLGRHLTATVDHALATAVDAQLNVIARQNTGPLGDANTREP